MDVQKNHLFLMGKPTFTWNLMLLLVFFCFIECYLWGALLEKWLEIILKVFIIVFSFFIWWTLFPRLFLYLILINKPPTVSSIRARKWTIATLRSLDFLSRSYFDAWHLVILFLTRLFTLALCKSVYLLLLDLWLILNSRKHCFPLRWSLIDLFWV